MSTERPEVHMQDYHRAVGRTQGIREAFPEGYREGLGQAIDAACDILGLEITPERRAELDTLDLAALEVLLSHLRRERCWPEDLHETDDARNTHMPMRSGDP